jgi:hypothetical protein
MDASRIHRLRMLKENHDHDHDDRNQPRPASAGPRRSSALSIEKAPLPASMSVVPIARLLAAIVKRCAFRFFL